MSRTVLLVLSDARRNTTFQKAQTCCMMGERKVVRDMRTMTLQSIDHAIQSKKKETNFKVRVSSTSQGRRKKTRTRTEGEIEALNQIAIARWQKAVETGKIKSLGERVFYYDYR
jgi:hypothetical protein